MNALHYIVTPKISVGKKAWMFKGKIWLQKILVLLWKIVQSLFKEYFVWSQQLKVSFHQLHGTILDAHHWRILKISFIYEWKLRKIFIILHTVTIWNSMKVGNFLQTLFDLIQWQSMLGIQNFVIIRKVFKNYVAFMLISWNISSIKLKACWLWHCTLQIEVQYRYPNRDSWF